jgi:hypothetical protein
MTEALLARDTIKASEKALIEVFCDHYDFRIPSYQRPYSWTEEQVDQLLDDLLGALDAENVADNTPYFLGSIVLIKHPDRREADVVDGQQRLTTLTMIFAVLRDLATSDKSTSIQRYIGQKGDPFAGTKDQFRLKPRPRDAEFFEKWVQKDGATAKGPGEIELSDSQELFIENTRFLREKLMAATEVQRDRLTAFMVQRCFLVVVEASNRKSAYRIFSVMNDRGLDLSPTDILKADIIGALPESQRIGYTEKWEDLEQSLGRSSFENLFSHIRMIHRRQKLRGNLEEEFREYVAPEKRPDSFIDDELSPLAAAYKSVSSPGFSGSSFAAEIVSSLKHLKRLDNRDWEAPTILFLSRKLGQSAAIKDFLQDLERLAYFLFVCRSNVNERILRYGRVIKAIQDDIELRATASPLLLTDEERSHFLTQLNGNIYEMVRIRTPLLLRLDGALSAGGAEYDAPIISVEHVLPQNPKSGSKWLKDFKSEAVRSQWTHRLSNLILLSKRKNAQASNLDFNDKKTKYFIVSGAAPFALTSQVNAEKEWTPEVLQRRQRELLATLKEVWKL